MYLISLDDRLIENIMIENKRTYPYLEFFFTKNFALLIKNVLYRQEKFFFDRII